MKFQVIKIYLKKDIVILNENCNALLRSLLRYIEKLKRKISNGSFQTYSLKYSDFYYIILK